MAERWMTPHTPPLLFPHQLGVKTHAASHRAYSTVGGTAPCASGCALAAKDHLRNRDPILMQMITAISEEGGKIIDSE